MKVVSTMSGRPSVRRRGDAFDVRHAQRGLLTDSQKNARVLVGGRREVCRVLLVHEADRDAHVGQDAAHHGVGAAVERLRRDDVVAGLSQAQDRVENGVGARGHGRAREGVSSLEHREARLEHVGGRVHQARVDVAELLEGEEVRGVLRVLNW